MPEPAEGFERNDDYRVLFGALSTEGSLEILRYLYAHKPSYYSLSAITARVGLERQSAEASLSAMERCHLVTKTTLETEDGSTPVYALHNNRAIVPFLFLARWLMEEDDA